MRWGLHVPNFGPFGTARAVTQLAVTAERSGWDGLFIWDHVVRAEGDFDVVDPWVALAAAAVATERILLGPVVTPLPRRRPWNVAKAAVAIDHLSGGRMVLGVGSGKGHEFSAFGEVTNPRERGDMLDEALAIIRAAWSGEPVSFAGQHYQVNGQRSLPTPWHAGGIPIWGATESVRGRPVRRAATLDGIVPIGITPDELPILIDAIGRDPAVDDTFDVVTVSWEDDARRWESAGATWWLRILAWNGTLDEALALIAAGPDRK